MHVPSGDERRARVDRDDLLTLQVDGTKGTAVAGLRDCKAQSIAATPRCIWNPDIERSLEYGCRLLKFFPAEQLGGLPYLRAMSAPYAHLGVRYVPLGGLTESNAGAYLKAPLISSIGGSWIAPREVIKAKDWAKITANAQGAMALASDRGG